VHLLRERELGFRNALTGNAKRCTKHKMLQTCDNILGCKEFFYDVYSSLNTCHSVIHGSLKQKYIDFLTYTEDTGYLIDMMYMFNIVKEYGDIYIEIRSCLDEEVKMTIDAKKIIPKLSVSLEEWEKLKEIRNWGALIRETCGNFMYMVGDFKESAY